MIKIRQVKIEVLEDTKEKQIASILKILHIKRNELLSFEIVKKSIDARDKDNIYFVYEFLVSVKNQELVLKKNKSKDVLLYINQDFKVKNCGKEKLLNKIVVVGMGPAGLFATYLLSLKGYRPLLIERGKMVSERIKDVEEFWKTGKLNTDSNIEYGEGGAGTFSDGKLNTLVKDKRHIGKFILETFVKHGAPEEILYTQNPHIGTDNLRKIVKSMRLEILKLGGEIRYQTKLTNIVVKNNKLEEIEVNNNELIPCNNLILAIGHSAIDTLEMLYNKKIEMQAKPFAVGLRIMHSQDMINKNQYRKYANILPPASYKLTYTTKKGRGVYSFCMCPGGYVVNASSEPLHLVINGMSNYKRDSKTSNSAIIVTVSKKDFGEGVFAGLSFQRKLEREAYNLACGKIPVQLLEDFRNNKETLKLGKVKLALKGNYEFKNLRSFLPDFITESLLEALVDFDKKIPGFGRYDSVLAGVETRTSSSVRIVRDLNYESNIKGIFPTGEGSGYSGGITTSAIDGILVAEELISRYRAC